MNRKILIEILGAGPVNCDECEKFRGHPDMIRVYGCKIFNEWTGVARGITPNMPARKPASMRSGRQIRMTGSEQISD